MWIYNTIVIMLVCIIGSTVAGLLIVSVFVLSSDKVKLVCLVETEAVAHLLLYYI